MSIINECLKQIMSARYGKDVRKSIHDGIKEVDSVARAAQNSATANAQTASAKASEALQASQEALKKAQEAQESAEQAKTYAENAEAVTGVNIGTQDRAGIIKGGENHIAEDGTLELVVNTTETTMPNSRKGGLLVDEIGGVCEQVTTTGSQLFDKDASGVKNGYYLSTNGAETASSISSISDYIDIRNLDNIFIKYTGSNTSNKVVALYDASKEFVTYSEYIGEKSIGVRDYSYIRITFVTAETGLLMVNAGSIALPWEPYTGGLPSPSPEYPQEIKNAVVSEIKTHGKNLINAKLNQQIPSNDRYYIYGISPGESLTMYLKQKTTVFDSTHPIAQHQYWFADKNGKLIKNGTICRLTFDSVNQEKEATSTITAPDGTDYLVVDLGTYFSDSGTRIMTLECQVERGKEFTGYEPYTESTITLKWPIELCRNGDVQDVLTSKQVKRRFKEVVFDGSADEGWVASSLMEGRYYIDGISNSVRVGAAICTHSTHIKGAISEKLNRSYFSEAVDGRFIINTSFATLDEWKAHLQANPMTLIYELATEETEEIWIGDWKALHELQTYEGITYLEFDSEVQPTFKGRYATSEAGSVATQAYCRVAVNEYEQYKATHPDIHILMEHGLMFRYSRVGSMVVVQVEGTLDYAITEENKVKTFNTVIPEGFRPDGTTHTSCMSITSKDSSGNRITALYDLGIGASGAIQLQVELKDSEGKSITASQSANMPFNTSVTYLSSGM